MKKMLADFRRTLICVFIALMLAGSVSAETSTVSVVVFGWTVNQDLTWKSSSLDGVFSVWQNGKQLGILETSGMPVELEEAGLISLRPVVERMPEGFLYQDEYHIMVSAGANTAPISLYANTGLFVLEGEPGRVYELISEDGETVNRYTADENGRCVPDEAVASGLWSIKPAGENVEAISFVIQAYTGSESEITYLKDPVWVPVPADEAQTEGSETDSLPELPEDMTETENRETTLTDIDIGLPETEGSAAGAAEDTELNPEMSGDEAESVSEWEGESQTAGAAEDTELNPEMSGDEAESVSEWGWESQTADAAEDTGIYSGENRDAAEPADESAEETAEENPDTSDDSDAADMEEPDAVEPEESEMNPAAPDDGDLSQTGGVIESADYAEADFKDDGQTEEESHAIPVMTVVSVSSDNPASIAVNVFIDDNTNGEKGKYEKLQADVLIYAVLEEMGQEICVASAVTDENGDAELKGLPEGMYHLCVIMPENTGFGPKGKEDTIRSSMTDTCYERWQNTESFRIQAGTRKEIGIGSQGLSQISGVCWLDLNSDGIMQDDEPKQAGVLVELISDKLNLTYSTVSGDDGVWEIKQVKNANYKVRATAPKGTMFTRYSKTGGQKRSIFTKEGARVTAKTMEIKKGKDYPDQNIGVMIESGISGICFLDENYNGFYDEGEPTLKGVKVEAIKQAGGNTVASDESDEDGAFTLPALRGGVYRIRALLPNDGSTFTCTVSEENGNHFKARSGRRENYWEGFTLENGEAKDIVVGAIYPASISGIAYMDDDFSATKDKKEKVASGLLVTLEDQDGNVLRSVKTNAKGKYLFDDLTPGQYQVRMAAREGYAFTRKGQDNVMLNVGNGNGETGIFFLKNGEKKDQMNAGMILPGIVQGTVFADRNDNGVQDSDEQGLAGTIVRLMSDEEGEHFRTAVGDSGAFKFDAVMPGTYYLQYELPEDAIFADVASGGNTITGENGIGTGQKFGFRTADTVNAPLCGALTLGRINGVTFYDHNGNGIQDADEEAAAGVSIELTGKGVKQESVTRVTEKDGSFSITGIHPGDYELKVVWPEGYVTSRTNLIQLPVAAGVSGNSNSLSVQMGQRWEKQQVGGVLPASLRGILWLDENFNGLMESGEATPSGETIRIIDESTDEVFAVMETGADGVFSCTGMIPGSFRVEFSTDSRTISAPNGDSTFTESAGCLVMNALRFDEGETKDSLRLGIARYTTVSGSTWIDRGGKISALEQAKITLKKQNGGAVESVVTGEDGTFRFEGLLPGDYLIEAVLAEGSLIVEPDDERLQGSVSSIMTETDGRKGSSGVLTVLMGKDMTDLQIGSVLPGKLGDEVWVDLNRNGYHDGNEKGFPGVKIELIRRGEVMYEAVSDQYGYYQFVDVYPATYTMRIHAPAEVAPTRRLTDLPMINSVMNEEDGEFFTADNIQVPSDGWNYNADLGFALRKEGKLPAGYGDGATQNWSKENQ